ncbi:MAG: nitrogen fixation protein NifH [Candidatus Thorarchaeota archaeon]
MNRVDDSIVDWLLEEDNPSVRYWTLVDILGKDPNDTKVRDAKTSIMNSACVQAILKEIHPEGYWGKEDDMYNPKYTATTHNLLILAEFGMERIPIIEKAIEHAYLFQRKSGHFLMDLPKTDKGYDSIIKDGCCYDGNILFYLIHFGYLDDTRTQRLISFQEDYYSSEEGGWKCRAFPIDPSKVFPVNCFMGRCKMLKALASIPEKKRSKKIKDIIRQEIEVILENQIYKYLKNPDRTRKEKAGWKRFGFPIFYQSDVLEVLDVLTRLGVRDDRMQESIDLVSNLRDTEGKWELKNSFNGKMICDIEEKGKPSKWITLRATRVLKRYYE